MVIRAIILTFLVILFSACAVLDQPAAKADRSVFLLVEKADRAYGQSRWSEAEQYYRQVIDKVPSDHYAWFRLGNTQLRRGLLDSAIYTYQQAEKRNPRHAKTQYNLALTYLMMSQRALHQSAGSLRENDPALVIVQQKLGQLQSLLDLPVEAQASPGRQPLTMK